MGVYTLDIPNWCPVKTNVWRGRHWSAAYKLRRAQASILSGYAIQQRVPAATQKRRVSIRLWGWANGRLPDRDAFDKLLLDSLVVAGLLLDDGDNGLDGRVPVEYERSKSRRTVITLEDV